MGFFLPQNVSNYIFIFLFFSSSFEKLFCLSRLTTKSLKNTYDYKKYKEFMDTVEMLREDKKIYSKHNNLEKKWLYYNLNRWPLLSNEMKEDDKIYKVGDFVDAKDFMNAWCPAKIIKITFKRKYIFTEGNNLIVENGKKIYEVEFLGWSATFNEKIDSDKIRKLTTYTTNPHNKMNNLNKKTFEKFWCLIKNKDEKVWKMERISEKLMDISNNLLLVSSSTQIYKISKENIDDIILPISNASCFLARKNVHTFNYSNRTFYL